MRERPTLCRNALRDEGLPYPKSCAVCGNGGLMGCPYEANVAVARPIDPPPPPMTTDTTARVSQGDYDRAADLAALAERICFGGNDAAALRQGIVADKDIEHFVRLIAAHRLAAIEEAAKVAEDHGSTWGRPYHSMTDAIAAAIRNLSNEGMQG